MNKKVFGSQNKKLYIYNMKKVHTLWVEKYRSINLEQYIGNEEVKNRISDCIISNDIPHFIFSGTAGTGKTTLAKLIVNNLKCDYLYLNASDENGIDMIREKVKGFASSASFNPIKVVILDEADFLTQPAQAALRNIIEEYAVNTRFVLTCNYIERLIEPLQSRCEIHKLTPPSRGEVAKHVCTNILDKEEVSYDIKDIANVIKQHYPDIRSVIKNLQAGTKENKFTFTEVNINWCNQIITILQKPTKDSWVNMRQVVLDAQVDDYQPLIEHLFENISVYGKEHEAEITVELDEAQWRSRAVPDKEINIAALLSKILTILKK
jgi:replication factor C small subunit